MPRATAGSIFSSSTWRTMPLASLPRRPARPDIWMYSPAVSHRKSAPSNLRVSVKTTVRAGMLMPIANVSVANRSFSRPSWNKISTTSFTMGSRPPWWMPMPLFRSGSSVVTCGSPRSSSLSASSAEPKTLATTSASAGSLNDGSSFSATALRSHCALENAKTMAGCQACCRITATMRLRSDAAWRPPGRFFGAVGPSEGPAAPSAPTALAKFSSLNVPASSTTRCKPSPPAAKT
mmetsp:Transcript_17285/g.53134  ORF Transcript_17285/g.53134 Transcript_17285/m.53134 type:complete len:235 (+) Transcript_17285:579-1283(+)